ncbi:MAG: hypothetical protein II973_13525 [Spirochaetaceae bacterium]|nr:hypothetical protein [Spirochaetaceae bacterium]
MKSKLISGLLLIFVLPVFLFAQEKSVGGILYGPNWACMVTAPEGWVMDQERLASYGIYGLFYASDKTFGGNTPIIYINTQKLNDDSDTELEKFISVDTNSYKNSSHKVKEYQLKNIEEKKIFAYEISKENNYEICAYTRYKNCCFLVVLTAHDEESIKENIPKLEFIINQMAYMELVNKNQN